MSSRLRDGNPNITDLNNQNRPTKLAELFSELYDNQWTNAYDAVCNIFENSITEYDTIQILLDILKHCFTVCQKLSNIQMDRLNENVTNIADIVTKKKNRLPSDLIQRIKEERKMLAFDEAPALESILPSLKGKFSSQYQNKHFMDDPYVKVFVNECLKLSWLMVIQDPPMAMIFKPKDTAIGNFKAYKTRGNFVKYIVWPALLLNEGGP